jgi:hypothetical protein
MLKFNDCSGIIETGGGYAYISRVSRDRLIEVLNRLPAGDIIITTAPHAGGMAVLVKPASESRERWHVLCPVIQEKANRPPYIIVSRSVFLNLSSCHGKS